MLRHSVGSVLNLENYFEDLKKPLVGHYLMLYWTGNLFFAVHQESKINIIKDIKLYLFKYSKILRSGVGLFRSCEGFFGSKIKH